MAYEPLIGQARLAKRMRMEMQCNPQWVLDLAAERDQLRAEVEALRKDAERYRWLRERHDTPGDYLCVTDGEDGVIIEETVGFDGLSLDGAIDAAMAAKEGV